MSRNRTAATGDAPSGAHAPGRRASDRAASRVAFLTTDLDDYFVTDDDLALEPLRRRGIQVEYARWREPVDWSAFDLVVIRSPWDYQRFPEDFLETLDTIRTATGLANPLPLIEWNLNKTYLRELAAAGIPVVPTAWRDVLEPGGLPALFRELGSEELVLKPAVGASGEDTLRVPAARATAMERELLALFGHRPFMAQPFLADVLEEGESSVIWLDGDVSHGIRKTPPPGEFRSQEEHGGHVEAVPVEGSLAEAAAAAARFVADLNRRLLGGPAPPPLYGRVDFLPSSAGWLLGELELVEPALYLRMDPGAPDRFADTIARRLATD